jgi:tetratricopeptide (TPR) repeat protein
VTPPLNTAKNEIIALLQSNQPARAKELCLALQRKTTDPHVLVLLANAHLNLGEVDAAIAAAREAIVRGWKEPRLLVMLIALLIRQGKPTDADAYFARLFDLGLAAIDAHRETAKVLHQLGDRTNAIVQYRRAVALGPQHVAAHFELALSLQEAGQFAEAADWYEKTTRLDPMHAQAYCNLGVSLAAIKQHDRATMALEESARLAPANALVHFHLGEIYQLQNRFQAAAACYRRGLELNPNAAALHGSLGRALKNLGDVEGAIACHRRALELEPNNAAAYHNLGLCLYDDRNLEPALKAFTQAAHLDPANALTQFYLGLIYSQRGDDAESQKRFSEASRLWPYLECFVDSFRYSRERGPGARYFSVSGRVFEHAIAYSAMDGLFLEFGVFHGTSITIIAHLTPSVVHGFDTFQGLPSDWAVDDGHGQNVEPAGSYSTHGQLPDVPENVRLHAGTFEETLPGFCREHTDLVSFMNIDCDLYSSTKTIFQHLVKQIQPGTVIVFDEYFCLPGWRDHEYKAFQEYISETGLSYEYLGFNLFTGQAIVRVTATV